MISRMICAAMLILFGLGILAFNSSAHSDSCNCSPTGVKIESSFARASASPAVKSGAAYLVISNHGDQDDRLIGASGDVAKRIELHTHKIQDGAMVMTEIEGGVVIEKGKSVTFQPGGDHIMFMGLSAPLVEGEEIPLTLIFEEAGEIMIHIPILGIGAMGDHSHSHGTHTHSE
jgi:copper(I)-binding protein